VSLAPSFLLHRLAGLALAGSFVCLAVALACRRAASGPEDPLRARVFLDAHRRAADRLGLGFMAVLAAIVFFREPFGLGSGRARLERVLDARDL
jgi:hypothetical protein